MTIYFSPTIMGFYDDRLFGAREIEVIDHAVWTIALETAAQRDAERTAELQAQAPGEPVEPVTEMQDLYRANPPMILTDNPGCRLPVDAVMITDEQYAWMMQKQTEGFVVSFEIDGPVARNTKLTPDQLRVLARTARDRALAASDWTQMPDSPLSLAKKKLWADHRKALRGLPKRIEAGGISVGVESVTELMPKPPT